MNNNDKELQPAYFPLTCGLDYVWRAVYQDGEGNLTDKTLDQYEYGGKENKYADIDRFKLGRFDLINKEGKVVFSIYIHQDQRLIFRRRNFIKLDGTRWLVYLVGWQMTFFMGNGQEKNITSLAYVFPDGSVAFDDNRNSLQLLPEEY